MDGGLQIGDNTFKMRSHPICMERGKKMFYVITILSLLAVVYIIVGATSKIPSMTNERTGGLTGNVIVNLDDNFEIGENISGKIILTKEEVDAYGFVLLTKGNNVIITETFSLEDIPKKNVDSGYSINIDDLINYKFKEKGKYDLFFSVLDLDINIRKEFVVE